MRCSECDGVYQLKYGLLTLNSFMVGEYELTDVYYYECYTCKKLAFAEKTVEEIEKIVDKKKEEFLLTLPIESFISLAEAAKILGVTKQGVYRNKKIREGGIYTLNHCGRKLYNFESVNLFKETGDGRFPFHEYF
jgi:hypothetical protein